VIDFFRDAPVGARVLSVAGAAIWMVASALRIRAQVLSAREQAEPSPVRTDFGVRRFRLIEWLALALFIGGLAWYVLE
jgi:hypothetical protein